jgi:molecular chaperone GrpE (heat shock protein)
MTLLSSSPLLASLFLSYANQAAVLESSTLPTESEEWETLGNTVVRLQEEVNKLKPENTEMMERLTAAAASLEAFRSQVTSLKEVNVAHQLDIGSLQKELFEFKDKYNRLVENSNDERDALQTIVSDLKVGLEPYLITG